MTSKTETHEEHRIRRKAEIKKAWDAALNPYPSDQELKPVKPDPVENTSTYCTEHGRQFASAGGYGSPMGSHTE